MIAKRPFRTGNPRQAAAQLARLPAAPLRAEGPRTGDASRKRKAAGQQAAPPRRGGRTQKAGAVPRADFPIVCKAAPLGDVHLALGVQTHAPFGDGGDNRRIQLVLGLVDALF